jgi:hypothetical protein
MRNVQPEPVDKFVTHLHHELGITGRFSFFIFPGRSSPAPAVAMRGAVGCKHATPLSSAICVEEELGEWGASQ